MQLENMMGSYQPMTFQEKQQTYFVVGNLENLSASALYTGKPCGSYSGRLTIRPIGQNSQLHIHEGEGGTAHIKTNKGEYQNITSYTGAMIDLTMDRAGIPKIKK